MSAITCESEAKKKDPGPQHKYNLQYGLLRPSSKQMVRMEKAIGRDSDAALKAPKKNKTPGPTSYDTEKGIKASAGFRNPINIPMANGVVESSHPDIKHQDKLKIKSNRFLDQVIKKSAKVPPVGNYANLEKAYKSVASLPTSLKVRRH